MFLYTGNSAISLNESRKQQYRFYKQKEGFSLGYIIYYAAQNPRHNGILYFSSRKRVSFSLEQITLIYSPLKISYSDLQTFPSARTLHLLSVAVGSLTLSNDVKEKERERESRGMNFRARKVSFYEDA